MIDKLQRLFTPKAKVEVYDEKFKKELDVFNKIENVHALPEIFHYWSHEYLRPKFLDMGIRGISEFFFDYMAEACAKSETSQVFISLGSGHSEIEIQITEMLINAGHKNFILECLDINSGMLDRGKELAVKKGVRENMTFAIGDASSWNPKSESYSVVMAHQSLHHFVELELLFQKIKRAIGKSGVFLTSDIIGRNGHMRWPEAMLEIDKIWASMPDRYKYNHALKRFEKTYENWDCSSHGFEGIRAQDILPLLNKNFAFEMFLGFGNLIDIFIDRAFGHNFDSESREDQKFIDKVAKLDDQLLESGVLKPTHIIAAMRVPPVTNPKFFKHLTPKFCIRKTDLLTTGNKA